MIKFVRYLAVQVVAYGLDMGGFLAAFEYLETGPIFANVCGKIFAGIFAFIAHRSFTFGFAAAEEKSGQIMKYFLLLALNLPFTSVVLSAAMLVLSPPGVAKFFTDIICVLVTYWVSKKYVFQRPGKVHSDEFVRDGHDA